MGIFRGIRVGKIIGEHDTDNTNVLKGCVGMLQVDRAHASDMKKS